MDTHSSHPERLKIGEGKISGYLSIFLASICLGAVICFHFPQYFTTPDLRAHYPIEFLRYVLLGCLILAFAFALLSFWLSKRSKLAFIALLINALAILLGHSAVEIKEFEDGIFNLGLDWLLIDILVLTIIFIPIELFLPQRRAQTKLHPEWKTDLVYFVVAHLLIQFLAVVFRYPAELMFREFGLAALQLTVKGIHFVPQLFLALLLSDLFQYWAHRTFHKNRFLWRFHAVHHSIKVVDWLAGSRLHFVDIVATRAFSYIPLYFCGFSASVFYTYIVIVSFQAVLAHANTRINFGWFKYVFVTPQYHHWHHSDNPEHYDENFAIHFPFIDMIFGTYYLPGDRWPESTGLGDVAFHKGYLKQLLLPFFKDPLRHDEIDMPSER